MRLDLVNQIDETLHHPPLMHVKRVYLKDFDLAGGRVEVLRVLCSVSLGERVNLDPEGDALLSTVLPGSELCADAVHLKADRSTRMFNVCV